MDHPIFKIVDALLGIEHVHERLVGEALGVPLRRVKIILPTEHFEANLPDGPFSKVTLRVNKERGNAILVLDPRDDPPREGTLELTAHYGPPTSMDVNPQIPPAGATAFHYVRGGKRAIFDFHANGGDLRTVAIHWDARKN
jgi:hypothetical protein